MFPIIQLSIYIDHSLGPAYRFGLWHSTGQVTEIGAARIANRKPGRGGKSGSGGGGGDGEHTSEVQRRKGENKKREKRESCVLRQGQLAFAN